MSDVVDTEHEERLLKAAEHLNALVDKGTSPTDALEKIAREQKLNRGDVDSLAWGHNIGHQLGQWRAGGNILDKMASFPLADPAVVQQRIWGQEAIAKAAAAPLPEVSHSSPPTWLADQEEYERVLVLRKEGAALQEKRATEALTAPPAPVSEDTRVHNYHRALGVVQRNKQACEEASRVASNAVDDVLSKVTALAMYFRKSAGARMTFSDFEIGCRTYFGKEAKPLLDVTYDMAKLGEWQENRDKVLVHNHWHEPRCPEKTPILKQALDLRQEPFTLVREAIDAAAACARARQRLKAAQDKAVKEDEEALRPFRHAGATEPQRMTPKSGELNLRPKSAGILGTPAVGAALGTMIGRTIGNVPKTKDDMIEDAWLDLEDPQHQNELRKIQAHTMLTSMMTDPENPISGHDPEKVLKAYNEISQIAPRAASNSASLQPLLQRHLEGHREPFEAKEMTEIEQGIAKTRSLTPDTNILGTGPQKLLA